jgi:tetratricopeptide (TPR) repeat protein
VKNTERKITGRRLWVFRLAALIIIPVLLIFILEFGLRLTGYGFDARAIIECKVKGQKAYCDNSKFTWLFFPPNIARGLNPFVIPAEKPANTYRIFVFGSSAAQGVPETAYGFSRILDCLLSERYPATHFEIINTAATAINSNVVVKIAEDCARYKPDLFIVYMGNNEVIGPYGAGSVFEPLSGSLSFIRLGITFRETRLGQLLTNLSQVVGAGKTPKVWRGMELFLSKQVSADDEKLQIVYKHFGENLETIVKTAEKRKVPVILSTVGSNLKDCPPFASLHRKGISKNDANNFDKLYKEARGLDDKGQYAEAQEKYLAAADIDGQFAELQFCLGRLFLQQGQYEKARQRYIKARELDAVRFRADNRINEIIRETAQKETSKGVYLADAVTALEKESPNQIPGDELFYEHVHLTFRGNYILAKTVYGQIEKTLPDQIKKQAAGGEAILDENKCKQYLAYSDWDLHAIFQSLLDGYILYPPFTNQLNHEQDVNNLEERINSLKKNLNGRLFSQIDAEYQEAINRRPTDWVLHWKYGGFLMDAVKDYRRAEDEFNKVVELAPQLHLAYVMLGKMWGRLGNFDEALKYYKETVKIKSTYAPAYYDMGLIYQKKRLAKEAEKNYEISLKLNPEHYPAYVNLSVLLYDEGRLEDAIKVCRRGLELNPDYVALHYNLGCIMRKKGQKEDAIKEFRTALRINPEYAPAKQDLENLLSENK